jgi:hypothetical protein
VSEPWDLDFDYRADLNPGRSRFEARGSNDPDTRSRPLQVMHQRIWSKSLPNGDCLVLAPGAGTQLVWRDFRLSSDSISNSYQTNSRLQPILRQVPDGAMTLFCQGSRISAYLLFPANQI